MPTAKEIKSDFFEGPEFILWFGCFILILWGGTDLPWSLLVQWKILAKVIIRGKIYWLNTLGWELTIFWLTNIIYLSIWLCFISTPVRFFRQRQKSLTSNPGG